MPAPFVAEGMPTITKFIQPWNRKRLQCVITEFAAPFVGADMSSIDTATARHLHEQRIDLERRKRLEAAERAREKINNPHGTLHRIRIGDLNKMFGACYGAKSVDYQFPDDDAGRIDAMILARHYANGNPSALARVLRKRLPWMAEADFQNFIARMPLRARASGEPKNSLMTCN